MSTNTFIVGAVLLTLSLGGPQQAAQQEAKQAELKRQQELEQKQAVGLKIQQLTVGQAIGVRVPLEGKVVKNAPYSAEFASESVQVLPDGNRIVHRSTGRIYRDSEGRTRREMDVEPGRAGQITISDPVANLAYSLDPATKVAWETPVTIAVYIMERADHATTDPGEVELRQKIEAELSLKTAMKQAQMQQEKAQQQFQHQGGVVGGVVRRTDEPEWEQKVEKLPARQIEGVMAEGTRTTRTIPAGAIGNEQPIVTVTEEWRSPELQVLVLTRTTDPRTGEATYRLMGISRGEPNLSWFEVPADYTVKQTGIRKAAGVMERR